MSASKRTLVDFDSDNFPGAIDKDRNLYIFPKLYKTNSNDKVREWSIFIRCIKEDSKNQAVTKAQNWDLMNEDEVIIKPEYVPDGAKLPTGIVVQYWTESGNIGMKISRSAATYVIAKNVGKKNERNALQQALVDCRSKYLKKIDEGSVTDIKVLDNPIALTTQTKYYPMLAKKVEDLKKPLVYPVYIQPKLDGNRCVAFLDTFKKPTYKNVILYSRQQKEYPENPANDLIRKSLLDVFIRNYDVGEGESLFLDGELYLHDTPLQEINSIIRGKAKGGQTIEYHVYDHFYPSYDKQPFSERTIKLKSIFKKDIPNVKMVETHLVETQEENDKLYVDYLDKHYEGIMIRTPTGPYMKSSTKKSEQLRSKDLLKRKELFDDEFEVVGYTQGNRGKEIGAVVWICASGDKTFNSVPNWTHEERYKIFKECEKKFDKKYKNKLLKIEFRGLSRDGVPLQNKAIEFREIK